MRSCCDGRNTRTRRMIRLGRSTKKRNLDASGQAMAPTIALRGSWVHTPAPSKQDRTLRAGSPVGRFYRRPGVPRHHEHLHLVSISIHVPLPKEED
jgi:hypothetical protein